MAIIYSSVLGKVRGKVGSFVVRQTRNGVVLATTPAKYTKSNLPDAVRTRNLFTSISKFSSEVNDNSYLKKIWAKSELPGNIPYRKILKANRKFLDGEFLTINNLVTPIITASPQKSIEFINNTINLILNDDVFDIKAEDFHLFVLIALTKPKNKKSLILQTESFSKLVKRSEFEHIFLLDRQFTHEFGKYHEMIVYPCFIFTINSSIDWYFEKGTLFTL